MALLLAPYNNSMRLGMGFNSYTQTLCIDNAVEIRNKQVVRNDNPSQVVTYSSKIVERLSDVVSSLNVSHSASIRKGTVEVSGNGDAINEDKIKASDVNAVVSVKVVNQTLIAKEDAEFCPMYGVQPGTQRFNDTFGDCYISGFITGGEFTGIVSMRVIDRSKTASVTSNIKKGLRSTRGAKEFTLDADSSSSRSANSELLKDTETTITVSWMGGGQVKDPTRPWTLDSVFAAAEAFPMLVSKCPQKTWAILTKYKANRSFVDQTRALAFSPLEYDLVAGYTSTLFDNYMEYKQLSKNVQDMMTFPGNYTVREGLEDALGLDVATLVAVRSAFLIEMNKIVQTVDILSKDPHALKKSGRLVAEPMSPQVQRIIAKAIGHIPEQAKGAFWNYEKPVEPLPPLLGRYQWLIIRGRTRASLQNAAEDGSSATSNRIPPEKEAFAELGDNVTDKKSPPEVHDANNGAWVQAKIVTLQPGKPPREDEMDQTFWEWGWVSRAALAEVATIVNAAAASAAARGAQSAPGNVQVAQASGQADKASTSVVQQSEATNASSSSEQRDGSADGPVAKVQIPATTDPPPGYIYGTPNDVQGQAQGQSASASRPSESMLVPQTAKPAANEQQRPPSPKRSAVTGGKGDDPKANDKPKVEDSRVLQHRSAYPENKTSLLDFDLMISPEIWANLLPLAKEHAPAVPGATASVMPGSLLSAFPPPDDDRLLLPARSNASDAQKLEILSAAYGFLDCTDDLQEMVQSGGTLTIDISQLDDLLSGHGKLQPDDVKKEERFLSLIFRYAGKNMQLFVHSPASSQKTYTISPSSQGYPVVKPTAWNRSTWATLGIVFGGWQVSEFGAIDAILAEIEKNFKNGDGTRHVRITTALVQKDPLPGVRKIGVIFYQVRPGGRIRCAVGFDSGGDPCTLTDRSLINGLDPFQKAAADALKTQSEAAHTKLIEEKDAKIEHLEKQQKIQQMALAENDSHLQPAKLALELYGYLLKGWMPKAIKTGSSQWGNDEALHPDWNGTRVQLFNSGSNAVLDTGGVGRCWLYGELLHAHPNQTVTLKCEGSIEGFINTPQYWWSLVVDDGKNALQLKDGKIVKEPLSGYNEGQQWAVVRGSDQFSIRIRARSSGLLYIRIKDGSRSEIEAGPLPDANPSRCDFRVLVLNSK